MFKIPRTPDDIDAYTDVKESILEKKADKTINKETAAAFVGYIHALGDYGEITTDQFSELLDLLPLTIEDCKLIDMF